MTAITTERLQMRPPTPDDAEAYCAYYASEWRASHGVRIERDRSRARFDDVLAHWREKGFGRFIVTKRGDDTPIGLIGPHQPVDYPEPEIAWHLWAEPHQGQGLAHEATLAARDYAYGTLGWPTAISHIRPENTRSIRLAERLGATRDDAAPQAPIGHHATYRHPAPEAA